MKLGDLVPNCTAANGWTCASDTIKVINSDAGVEFQARYWVWAKLSPAVKKNTFGNDESKFTPGWYKLNGTAVVWEALANDWPLEYGTAILIKSGSASATISSNGEVVQTADDKILLELPQAKWRFVGNATPKNLTLGDFVPNCTATGGWTCSSDTIKILNKDAGVEYQARYWVWAKLSPAVKKNTFGNDESKFTPGWYKLDGTAVDWTANANNEPINAGSGFLAKSGGSAAVIEIPTAL